MKFRYLASVFWDFFLLFEREVQEFPGGLVVRILGFPCHGLGSVPDWEHEIPQAVQCGEKKLNKIKRREASHLQRNWEGGREISDIAPVHHSSESYLFFFLTKNKSILIHHNHPKFIVYLRVHC